MMKSFFILMILFSANAFAQSFEGCGEYEFKGIVRKDKSAPLGLVYVVNEETRSQLNFPITSFAEIKKLSLFINQPTQFQAKILKNMDGTKGEFSDSVQIEKRFPNPLLSTDTGITRIKILKCN